MAEWGKLYGSLHDDPKWRALTKGARALWTTANSWCIDHHKTDGRVPSGMLAGLDGTRSEAARLVLAGLWHDAGHSCDRCPRIEDGWVFHDWPEHQRTSDQVESDREAQAERQRRARERRASRRDSQGDSREGHVARREERRGEEKETPNGVSPAAADADGFDAFWAAYPRRDGKGQARKAYTSALKRTDRATILIGAQAFAELCRRRGTAREYTPMPSTWLNGDRWDDDALHTTAAPVEQSRDPDRTTREPRSLWDTVPNVTDERLAREAAEAAQ